MNKLNPFPLQECRPASRRVRKRWRGAATLEAIIAIPVLVIVTVAAIEFGIVLVIDQAIAHAATVAVREAAKEATVKTPNEVANELVGVVNTMLATHQLEVGPSVALALEVGGSPTESRGSLTCDPPTTTTVAADEIRVTICVRLDTAPFPNFLSGFGVDISNRCVRRSSLAKKEIP